MTARGWPAAERTSPPLPTSHRERREQRAHGQSETRIHSRSPLPTGPLPPSPHSHEPALASPAAPVHVFAFTDSPSPPPLPPPRPDQPTDRPARSCLIQLQQALLSHTLCGVRALLAWRRHCRRASGHLELTPACARARLSPLLVANLAASDCRRRRAGFHPRMIGAPPLAPPHHATLNLCEPPSRCHLLGETEMRFAFVLFIPLCHANIAIIQATRFYGPNPMLAPARTGAQYELIRITRISQDE
jgi:hypothetical protein